MRTHTSHTRHNAFTLFNRVVGCRAAWRPLARGVLASGLALALAACGGNMALLPANTPLDSIVREYGKPTQTCTTDSGQQRVLWTQQPFGQYAWGANITPDGRAERVELVLSNEHFERLREGVWTPERVLCEFGPPAKIDKVGLPSSRQIVWNYRYRENGVWNSLMYVYFGTDGKKVTHFNPGPDPLFSRDGFWFE